MMTVGASGFGQASKINRSEGPLATSLERLSSGKKINSAKDDAAGLAIAVRFASQIMGSQQGYRNANDGISLAQTADAAMSGISSNVQRIRELATQSANGIYNANDRAAMQKEVDILQQEITRTTASTEFNGNKLLDNAVSLNFQVGPNTNDSVSVSTSDVSSELNTLGVNTIDISTAAGAVNALTVADNATDSLSATRAEFGAAVSRFESAGRSQKNIAENLAASQSRIVDTDYARESSNLTKNSLLQQSENAMRSQANTSARHVLTLLSGL